MPPIFFSNVWFISVICLKLIKLFLIQIIGGGGGLKGYLFVCFSIQFNSLVGTSYLACTSVINHVLHGKYKNTGTMYTHCVTIIIYLFKWSITYTISIFLFTVDIDFIK